MSPNLLVKIAAGAVLAVVVALVVVRWSRATGRLPAGTAPVVGGEALSPETAAALGIEGDTPDDTVRTLIASVRETNARLVRLEDANRTLRDDNARLRSLRASVVAELSGSLAEEAARLREENRGVVADARAEVSGPSRRDRPPGRGRAGRRRAPPARDWARCGSPRSRSMRPGPGCCPGARAPRARCR